MSKLKYTFRLLLFLTGLTLGIPAAICQNGFNNSTRALFIFDLAKYIDYGPGFSDSSEFKIGFMVGEYDLIHEMDLIARTRKLIQNRPVKVAGFSQTESIKNVQILYVSKKAGFSLDKIKEKISGKHTMLITEGYEFRESMINFIVVDGKPRFDINEDYIKKEGMSVPENLLYTAVKTKEDWQGLFNVASKEIEVQKETISEQLDAIETQKNEILDQRFLLRSLDIEIELKEKTLEEKQIEVESQSDRITRQQTDIVSQKKLIASQQQEVLVQKDTLEKQRGKIDHQLARINDQLTEISEQDQKIKMQLEAIEKQKLILLLVLLALLLVSVLGYFIYRGYVIKREANKKLEEKNKTISLQKDEIEKQRDLASAQRDQIIYQKKQIEDSIMYAKRIQTALIPSLEQFSEKLEHFVLYKPLAIVSGDFYWVSNIDNLQVIITADCTGHGVPGAFMSMLGVTLLNEIINSRRIIMPEMILDELRTGIIKALKQHPEQDSVKDGMDIAICIIDFERNILLFAGANIPLYLVRDGILFHYKEDNMPVAIHYRMDPFTRQKIELKKGDSFYIFSDGYCDQFGGPKQKKFLTSRLKEALLSMAGEPMVKQGEMLNQIFENWKNGQPQVDDVLMIGMRY